MTLTRAVEHVEDLGLLSLFGVWVMTLTRAVEHVEDLGLLSLFGVWVLTLTPSVVKILTRAKKA
jgi:hypothetical protein